MVNADLDLRKLRYFLAVADALNFGRAAEELMIAQPVLSRQIRALEKDLGAQLFLRDTRGTRLTPIGEQLQHEARSLLAGAAGVRRRISMASHGAEVFSVGFMPGIIVTDAVRAFSARHPGVSIDVTRTSWADQVDVIHDGRVDVGFVRLPIDETGLRVEPLFEDPRVVMLPRLHALAEARAVRLDELKDEHLVQDPSAVPEWAGVATEMRGGRARTRSDSPTVEEKLELVASLQGIAILPMSTAQFYRRPDVTFLPVVDLAPNQVALAWEASRDDALIADFVGVVHSLPRPSLFGVDETVAG